MSDLRPAAAPVIIIERVLGDAGDEAWRQRLHRLAHDGGLQVLAVQPADLKRRRFRAWADGGSEVVINLSRDSALFDGAVLHFDDACAVVLKVGEQKRLRLRPADLAAAVELGYLAGNLHWRVQFDGGDLVVAVDGPEESYQARLRRLIEGCRVERVG